MKLATIGYENDTQGSVIQRLKEAGVTSLIDVRAGPTVPCRATALSVIRRRVSSSDSARRRIR